MGNLSLNQQRRIVANRVGYLFSLRDRNLDSDTWSEFSKGLLYKKLTNDNIKESMMWNFIILVNIIDSVFKDELDRALTITETSDRNKSLMAISSDLLSVYIFVQQDLKLISMELPQLMDFELENYSEVERTIQRTIQGV